ncbi:MAG: proteasome accessory factor PafA2 family protein [Armatimonadetes bacterium]|nr:proteasome accessory factor PafA2 family protein [Armatimonadota bacterium]MDE2206660.1 proteasome accessory factor PafA2 family protein [Armatimonadota bacterium]
MTIGQLLRSQQNTGVRTVFGMETEYFLQGGSNRLAKTPQQLTVQLLTWIESNLPCAAEGFCLYLPNGGRCYEDIGNHLEITTPECESPDELVRFACAGDLLLAEAIKQCYPNDRSVTVWRGFASYHDGLVVASSHENYTARNAATDYEALLLPFLITRIIFTGSGAMDWSGERPHFVLSPRAACINYSSLSDRRPTLWSHRESLCSARHRVHLTTGDAHGGEFTLFLRVAATALVLAAADVLCDRRPLVDLERPMETMDQLNRDPTLRTLLPMKNGLSISPFDIQRRYIEFVERAAATAQFPSWTAKALQLWKTTIDRLETDPHSLDTTLDWRIRFRALAQVRDTMFTHVRTFRRAVVLLRTFDSHFLAVGESGFQQQLDASGAQVVRSVPIQTTWDEVVLGAPATTRASLRSEWIRAHSAAGLECKASWDALAGPETSKRIPKLFRDEYSPRWLRGFTAAISAASQFGP